VSLEIPIYNFKIQTYLESGIWNQESGIRNLESGIWNQESGIWNLELEIHVINDLMNSENPIAKIARLISESSRAIAFTGAGISTESGIADFRSPGGVWSKYQPVYFQDFLQDEDARRRYWKMKQEGYRELKMARPNEGHRALARLEAEGKLLAVITQNIDGLHQDAGSRRVLELHGTSRHCICLKCNARFDPDEIQASLEAGVEVPLCKHCGGLLKSATISFGQSLPADILTEAFDLSLSADLVLALGSSLVVEPAASIPLQAKNNGARLVIINHTETPLDRLADVVVNQSISATLSQVLKHMGYEIS
jgi:NAD-dependent deacetylase